MPIWYSFKFCNRYWGYLNEELRQKKFEGRLIALMPLAMLVILNLLSPSYVIPLYAGLPGRLIMTGCLGAGLAGLMMMEKISHVDI